MALGLAGCASNDVFETVQISMGDIRCSEHIRINHNQGGVSVGVSGIAIGPSQQPHGTAHVGISLPVESSTNGKNPVEKRCRRILEEANLAAILERQQLAEEIELLRLKKKVEEVRLKREQDALNEVRFNSSY